LALGSAGLSLRVTVAKAPPSSTEVEHEWSCTSVPPYAFMACKGTNLPFLIIN